MIASCWFHGLVALMVAAQHSQAKYAKSLGWQDMRPLSSKQFTINKDDSQRYLYLKQSQTRQYKQLMLARHNRYREYLGISELSWSRALEDEAFERVKFLARSCKLDSSIIHNDRNKMYGENINQFSGTFPSTKYLVASIIGWEVEAEGYDSNWTADNKTNSATKAAAFLRQAGLNRLKGKGPMTGHAEQMAWKRSTHVGCAAIQGFCKNAKVPYGVIQVCSYSPAGNVNNYPFDW